jgi:CDP-paratose 2-epimerase
MNIVVTGSAGFFGSYVTNYLIEQGHKVIGLDNLSRRGSELNAKTQRNNLFMEFHECDVSDKIALDSCLKEKEIDWIVDCAADPSVMAGLDGKSMGVINNNLITTINLLEICKNKNAGFILMSTSRVYSIADLVNLEINEDENPKRFTIPIDNEVSEKFSTKPPISLYGSTKLTSELLAIEYGNMYKFPVWINRCGVIAGAGQFGKIDQGIFSFWIYSWLRKNPVKYVGFNGSGKQVRDAIHPNDICKVMNKQIHDFTIEKDPIYNLGGGFHNSMSLKELTEWCYININDDDSHITESKEVRKFDIPVYITNYDKAKKRWDFKPTYNMDSILSEIRDYAINNKSFMEYIHE